MNRFRLRQLESKLGRGPRNELCQDCGGLSIEQVFLAMEIAPEYFEGKDEWTAGDSAQVSWAKKIIDTFDSQTTTCVNCNGKTTLSHLLELIEDYKSWLQEPEEEPPCRRNENAARDC